MIPPLNKCQWKCCLGSGCLHVWLSSGGFVWRKWIVKLKLSLPHKVAQCTIQILRLIKVFFSRSFKWRIETNGLKIRNMIGLCLKIVSGGGKPNCTWTSHTSPMYCNGNYAEMCPNRIALIFNNVCIDVTFFACVFLSFLPVAESSFP